MKRKKRRDQCARPSGVCCPQQKPEDKQGVCYMNQCVNQQMATCIHAEELAVDHMCDPREWMPVPLVKGGKGPGHSRESNAAIYHAVCEATRAFNCAWSKKYGWRDLIRALEQDPQCPLSRHRFVQFNSLKYKRHASGSQRPSCVRRSFASSSDQSFRTSGSSSRTCSRSTLINYAGPPMP